MESYEQIPSILVIGETLISFFGNFEIPFGWHGGLGACARISRFEV